VWRANGNKYASFADFEAPEPVDYGNAMNAVFLMNLKADFAHFGEGHGLIGLVIEIESRAVVGLITHEAVEGDNGAVLWATDKPDLRSHIDGFAHQLVDVIVGECHHVDVSAAAHGREKCNLVAGTEWRIPGGKFLVARRNHRRAVFCELWITRRIESEELLDRRRIGELGGILSMAGDVLEAAEKEDRHANRL